MKRGGGRRYYRPEDITLLRQIRGLLYDHGYTIRGVQKVLREGGRKAADGSDSAPGNVGDDAAANTVFAESQRLDSGQRQRLSKAVEELSDIRDTLRRAGG
jgi:DNA-binding transcriptional MerR regulator